MNLFAVLGSLFFDNDSLDSIKPFGSEFKEDITTYETKLTSKHSMGKTAIITRTNFSGYPSHAMSGYSNRPIMNDGDVR